jgi:hypothetical protein
VTADVSRGQVLAFRSHVQGLGRTSAGLDDTAVLDIGVQDTGADGGLWALAIRGVDTTAIGADLVLLWTVRGAPHFYRRAEAAQVAAAVEPFSDADAGKRIFDASKPLKAAGIGNLEALDAIAESMRDLVTQPTVKGDLSGRLSAELPEPYLRYCHPCDATHVYEMPFRLAALRAGLELQPDTSPPVLRRIPGFRKRRTAPAHLDVVRAYLHLLGPATPRHVAGYLDAPLADVKARWPDDAVEVTVEGSQRWALPDDLDLLATAEPGPLRLLPPFDLYLQARDRELLVGDKEQAKALWPSLGRPGAVLVGGDLAGTWRPRKAGKRLTVAVDLWAKASPQIRSAVDEQAQRLAAHRGLSQATVDYAA